MNRRSSLRAAGNGFICFVLMFATLPHPARAQDAPRSGFNALQAAASLMVDEDTVNKAELSQADQQQAGHVYTLAEKQRLVDENSAALKAARAAVQLPYRNPDVSSLDERLPWFGHFRAMARLLALSGEVKAQSGDTAGAADDYLAAMHMGSQIFNNGADLGCLVGIASEAIARRRLWELASRADASTARRVAAAVMADQAATPPPSAALAVMQRGMTMAITLIHTDPDQALKSLSTSGSDSGMALENMEKGLRLAASQGSISDNVAAMSAYYLKVGEIADQPAVGEPYFPPPPQADVFVTIVSKKLLPEFINKELANHAQNSLLATLYGLHAYTLTHHALPSSLAEMVPTDLPRVPSDPFNAGAPLKYKRTGEKFLLYSIGPDGVDNSGAPLQSETTNSTGAVTTPNSTGDIRAGVDVS